MKKRKIGEVPPGKIMVLDPQGRLRATAARFTNRHGAKLTKGKNGERDSWSFPK